MSDTAYTYAVSAFISVPAGDSPQPAGIEESIVQDTTLVTSHRSVTLAGANVVIVMKAALSAPELAALDAIVANHTGSFDPATQSAINQSAVSLSITIDDDDDRTVIGGHDYSRGLGGRFFPPRGGALPADPVSGELFYNESDSTLYFYTGAVWQAVQSPVSTHAGSHHTGGGDELNHDSITGTGSNTHAQLDAHVASAANPHAVTAAQVGAPTETQHNAHVGNTANPHATTAAQVGAIPTTEKGAVNGVATLDGGGKVPASQIPSVALPSVSVVANASARLALAVQEGDEAIQLDDGSHWIYDGSAWQQRPQGGANALPLEWSYGEDETQDSTSSGYYQQKMRHNFAVAGGLYLVSWRMSYSVTSNNKDIDIRVELDDSNVLCDLQERVGRAASDLESSGFRQVSLAAGSHYIDVDFRKPSGGNYLVTLRRTRISVQRVG